MNVRKDIVIDQLLPRLQEIQITNGYQTNLGNNVLHRYQGELDKSNLPALIVFDTIETRQPADPNSGARTWELTTIINVVLPPADDNEAKAYQAIGDILDAINKDSRWNQLAKRTDEVSQEVKLAKDGTSVGGAQLIFKIVTSRKPFAH